MIDKNGVLTISGSNFASSWTMNLDLNVVAEQAGTRKTERWQENGVWHSAVITQMTLAQARKIVDMIIKHADLDDLREVDALFKKNAKLYKIWREKLEKIAGGAA